MVINIKAANYQKRNDNSVIWEKNGLYIKKEDIKRAQYYEAKLNERPLKLFHFICVFLLQKSTAQWQPW